MVGPNSSFTPESICNASRRGEDQVRHRKRMHAKARRQALCRTSRGAPRTGTGAPSQFAHPFGSAGAQTERRTIGHV